VSPRDQPPDRPLDQPSDRPEHPDTPSLRHAFPALHEGQSTWLGQIDSLQSPDRKTHELVRLACSAILRHSPGVERHAMLAAEFGATWEDVVGTLALTQPGFGLVPSLEALPFARSGFERGLADTAEDADDTAGDS
jgi:alkylhydroperoxidase/carboxymuconolactone decarboxylase family protein YurZ